MAFTEQQLKDFFVAMLATATPENRQHLSETATPLITQALGEMMSEQRASGIVPALAPLVGITVNDWTVMKAVADQADGATLNALMPLAEQYLYDEDAAQLAPVLFAVWFAMRKHRGIQPYVPPVPPE